MQNTIWKLTAVAGVLGIGTLVVLQAQRGLTRSGDNTELAEFDEEFATSESAADDFESTETEPTLAEEGELEPSPFEAENPGFAEAPPSQFEPQPAEPTLADPGGDPFSQNSFEDDSFGEEPQVAEQPAFEPDPNPAGPMLAESTPQLPAESGGEDPFAESVPLPEPEPDPAMNEGPGIVPAGHEDPGPSFGDDVQSEITIGAQDAGGPRMLAPNPLGEPIEPETSPEPELSEQAEPSPFGDEEQTVEVPAWDDGPEPAPAGFDDSPPTFGPDNGQDAFEQDTPQPEPVDNLLGAPEEVADSPEEAPEDDLPVPADETEYPSESQAPGAFPEIEPVDEPLLLNVEDEEPAELSVPEPEPLAEEVEEEIRGVGGENPGFPEPDDLPLEPEPEGPQTLMPEDDSEPIPAANDDYLTGDATVHQSAPQGAQRPQLQIEKVAPGNAVLGQPLIYSIVVRNHGQTAAHQVVVKDNIPAGSRLSGTIPRAELVEKQLQWKLGTVGPGEERTIKVRVVPTKEGQIGSIATVNFAAEVAAQTVVTAPKIDFDLLGPEQARLGEPVTFSFRVANNGSGNASGVVIRNLLPDALKHSGGNDLEYEVGDLPAGKSMEVKLTLTAAELGQVVNRAILTADGGVSTEARSSIEVVGSKLKITRTGPEKRFLGRPAEYVNTVVNESDVPARMITVVEQIPPGLDFVASTNGGRYDPVQRTVVWRIEGIGPRDSRVLKVKLVARQEGTQKSLVSLVDATGNRKEVTSETTVVGFTNVGLQLSPIESPVEIGAEVSLKVRAKNSGTNPANNVQISLDLPEGLEPVSIEGPAPYTQEGRTLRFDRIARIEGGREAAIDLVLIATDPGNGRLHFELDADDMQSPLVREEPIYVTE